MNYFGLGMKGWVDRLPALSKWLAMAGRYGDVTIALEPLGTDGFGVFHNSPQMARLKAVFLDAQRRRIKIWIRFGSEANLKDNVYSVFGSRAKATGYYRAAVWFKSFMPNNTQIVFSPLINTVIGTQQLPLSNMHKRQFQTIEWMLFGGTGKVQPDFPYDCIGGTLYRTDIGLETTFNAYYRKYGSRIPNLPFELCELGGPYSRRDETTEFLKEAAGGKWPRLRKINLFARQINGRADPNSEFGYMPPTARRAAIEKAHQTHKPMFVASWLKNFLIRQ